MSTNSIQWVDDDGAASLSNLKGEGGNRFGGWTPSRKPIGPAVTGLGTGRLFRYEFRRDDLIDFEIAAIPGSELELMLRLQYHLMNGGIVTLTTDRPLAANFVTCALAPDTEPSIDFSDRQTLEYTFSVTLRASTATPADILSPAFVPGLKLWLDASTLDAEQDDFISLWPDSSGNDNDAVQSNPAKQPRYKTTCIGGKPGLEFDFGSGDSLNTPLILNPVTLGATLFLVARLSGTPAEHNNFLGLVDVTGGNASGCRIFISSSTPTVLNWKEPTAVLGSSGITTGFVSVISFVSIASALTYFNGATGATFNPDDSLSALRGVLVGRDNSGSGNTGENQICEILLYEGVLSTANRNIVTDYLGAKYGITLA